MNGRSITQSAVAPAVVSAVALALTVLFWGPGDAEAQRYKRDTTISSVKVERTAKTKQLAPKGEKKKALPELTADEFITVEGKVKNIRRQQVQEYELLIEDTDNDDPELPDLLFRLAELHAQQQRYWRFQAMEMYSKIEKASPKQRGALKQKQKRFLTASKQALLNAVKAYKRVAENQNFRNYPRMDQVLFYYAYTLQGAKYMKEARKVYHRLIKDYPDSKFIPEAYLAFADYYFAQNSLANAERFYDKVLQFPKSSVYDFALYKKGWVFYNLGGADKMQEALETWYKVAQRTNRNKKYTTLNRAAKKDVVRAYAEVGKPEKAYAFFQRTDKGYAFEMLQILGDIYIEKGMAEKAIYTFREMIRNKPKHKQVCDWQFNVVHAMLTIGSDKQKVDEIENLVKLYSAYKDKNILPTGNLSDCKENAEGVTSEMAKIWHNEALKTLNLETLAYVDRLYQLFLGSFPESPEHGEMQFYYAELMWSRAFNEKNQRVATELWETTAVAFTDVVKSGKLKGKKLKESAYAAVLAWKNALDVDPRTKAPPPPPPDEQSDKVPEPQKIPARELKMVDAFDVYINYIKDPKDEELVMMKFLKARIYWRYNHFDEAAPLFGDIVEHHIDHETSETAVQLLLDTLNNARKYDELLKWVDILLEKKKYLAERPDLQERLDLLKAQSLRKAAEQLEKRAAETGDFAVYEACGTAYIEIFNRNPKGEKNDEVLYNAGVCFEKGKSIGTAIAMFELLSANYPKSPHTQKAIARLGRNFARIAWYDRAAEKFELYAKKFAGEKDAFEVLGEAVFYRKGIGDDKEAIEDTELFIRKFGRKRATEAAEAMFSMTSIYEKQGDNDKVIRHLKRYLKEYGRRGGVDRQIIAHAKIGMILWQESCPVRGVNGACVKIQRERATVRRGKRKRSSLPSQCGPESKIKLTVVDRDRRRSRDAKREFQSAISLFGGGKAVGRVPGDGKDKDVRAAAMIKHYAAAKFYLAEEQYESFLSLKFPTKLDFDPRNKRKAEQSKKTFMKWYTTKEKTGAKTSSAFDEVRKITGGGAHYAIAAAARMGQVAQNFSDQLFTAEIPRDVRTGKYAEDAVAAYCDELTTQAEPLEKLSVDAFGFCLKVSTDLNWFNEWSKLCERELGQIRPQEYPTAVELRATADNVAPITTIAKPVIKLE